MKEKKVTVTFYMKSGNVFQLQFDKFEITTLSGSDRSMKYKGCSMTFSIDIEEIEAVTID